MGTLFYLTIVASHYPYARLTYNNSEWKPNVFVRCGACLRAEGKALQKLILSGEEKSNTIGKLEQRQALLCLPKPE
jgi:hypothetical protein